MKTTRIKQHLFITDPQEFVLGRYGSCFVLYADDITPEGWIYCGEIELELDASKVNEGKVRAQAVKDLNKQIENERMLFTLRLDELQRKKNELLALPQLQEVDAA